MKAPEPLEERLEYWAIRKRNLGYNPNNNIIKIHPKDAAYAQSELDMEFTDSKGNKFKLEVLGQHKKISLGQMRSMQMDLQHHNDRIPKMGKDSPDPKRFGKE